MEAQKPSIGRIVHFNRQSGDVIVQEAALVIDVHTDTVVTLQVCNRYGTWLTERSIDFGSPEKAGSWCWPARV